MKKISPTDLEKLYELPMAKKWLAKKAVEVRAYNVWLEILKYLSRKYCAYQMPKYSSDDLLEKKYYTNIYNQRRRIQEKDSTYETVLRLPTAKEWILELKN